MLPDDHPFTRAMPYSKYHLAVTRQHDAEYRATSPWVTRLSDTAAASRVCDGYRATSPCVPPVRHGRLSLACATWLRCASAPQRERHLHRHVQLDGGLVRDGYSRALL